MFVSGLAGGGGGNWRNSPTSAFKWLTDHTDYPIDILDAKYYANLFRVKGMPIPVVVQKVLAANGLEVITPGAILAPATPNAPAISVGTSTPQQQQAQSAAIAQQLQTPSPAAPIPTPAPAVLSTPSTTPAPAPTSAAAPAPTSAVPTSAAPADLPVNFLPADSAFPTPSVVPGVDNKTLLVLGAGALALFMFGKKGRR